MIDPPFDIILTGTDHLWVSQPVLSGKYFSENQ